MKYDPNLTIPEILAIAIRAEINAQKIYQIMAKNIINKVVKEKFIHLSQQEKQHEDILTAKYQEVMSGEKPVIPTTGRTEVEKSLLTDYSHEAGLKIAIQAEEMAVNFYLDAAKNSRDINGRFMFEYLANFERGHKAVLEDELHALETNPHWFDIDGNPWGDQSIHVGP